MSLDDLKYIATRVGALVLAAGWVWMVGKLIAAAAMRHAGGH